MIRQFDLVDNPSPQSRVIAPFLMVVQSHLYEEGPTLLVAPLLRMDSNAVLTKVSLAVSHERQTYILMLSEMGAISRRTVTIVRGSLLAHEDDIRRALDRLFTGF
ncbi:MAG: CcdB family protein [Brevundimonas sp.]|uniref:CcdB family protein n=1 Tax=Brevundimonas sp. TaxID=1871086 RepID=UPI002736F4B0|nr:CcdB family protein [Brevundimonas sp.]MDP3403864.1 CcdB family protein [Brevundimonas sp.]